MNITKAQITQAANDYGNGASVGCNLTFDNGQQFSHAQVFDTTDFESSVEALRKLADWIEHMHEHRFNYKIPKP